LSSIDWPGTVNGTRRPLQREGGIVLIFIELIVLVAVVALVVWFIRPPKS